MVLTPAQPAELSRACLATIHPFVVRTTVVSSSVLHWARVQKTTKTDNHQQIGQIGQRYSLVLYFYATHRYVVLIR